MTREELKLRTICLTVSFAFAAIADVLSLGFTQIFAAISAVILFSVTWMPWSFSPKRGDD